MNARSVLLGIHGLNVIGEGYTSSEYPDMKFLSLSLSDTRFDDGAIFI